MKKILLTTSALTLLAGAAAADVSVGGYARIGVRRIFFIIFPRFEIITAPQFRESELSWSDKSTFIDAGSSKSSFL